MLTSHQKQQLLLTALLPLTSHTSGKDTSVPLPTIGGGARGPASPVSGTGAVSKPTYEHIIHARHSGYMCKKGLNFVATGPLRFGSSQLVGTFPLQLCIFQHMHAFSVPAASQNTLNRLSKNTFMPMLTSFVRPETVRLHLTDLLLLCVC